jgi:uncharacterized membrane protein
MRATRLHSSTRATSIAGPDWTALPRGPDVSPELRWYPVVTMLQLVLDMLMANGTPMGYGHVFAPAHYVDAWLTSRR